MKHATEILRIHIWGIDWLWRVGERPHRPRDSPGRFFGEPPTGTPGNIPQTIAVFAARRLTPCGWTGCRVIRDR